MTGVAAAAASGALLPISRIMGWQKRYPRRLNARSVGQIKRKASMSTPKLVETFYERIWNVGDLDAVSELVIEEFSFRGSLGVELRGRKAFAEYVRAVRSALANYHCEILTCVAEAEQAFAQMHFSGVHVAPFRGYSPTGKSVHWYGAALFRFKGQAISELWVLGDLAGLDAVLKDNNTSQHAAAAAESARQGDN